MLGASVALRARRPPQRAPRKPPHRFAVGPALGELGSAAALTLGTAAGGWSIMRTVGRRIYHLHPVDGLCSQGASAAVI